MNRAERRKYEKQGYSPNFIMNKYRTEMYEQGVKDGMRQVVEILFYMTAYTINYKLGFGKKRLQWIMRAIYNNIDAYRTGHLLTCDYDEIVRQMNKLGIKMN